MIGRRGWIVVALWTAFAVSAASGKAYEVPDLPVSCGTIRVYVAMYGQDAAEAAARARGWTDKQIALARRCLR